VYIVGVVRGRLRGWNIAKQYKYKTNVYDLWLFVKYYYDYF